MRDQMETILLCFKVIKVGWLSYLIRGRKMKGRKANIEMAEGCQIRIENIKINKMETESNGQNGH
jgi:hypothetical protein